MRRIEKRKKGGGTPSTRQQKSTDEIKFRGLLLLLSLFLLWCCCYCSCFRVVHMYGCFVYVCFVVLLDTCVVVFWESSFLLVPPLAFVLSSSSFCSVFFFFFFFFFFFSIRGSLALLTQLVPQPQTDFDCWQSFMHNSVLSMNIGSGDIRLLLVFGQHFSYLFVSVASSKEASWPVKVRSAAIRQHVDQSKKMRTPEQEISQNENSDDSMSEARQPSATSTTQSR